MPSSQPSPSSSITVAASDLIQQLRLSLAIPQIVAAVQRRQLIFATAKARRITVSAEHLQAEADRFRLEQQLLSPEQTWDWLCRHNLTLEDLELRLQENLLEQQLAEHLFADRVEAAFAETYLENCKYCLYELVVENADFAMELFYALQAEEVSFAALARIYGRSERLRRRAGYLGQLRRSELPPEISTAVVAAEPPVLLRPIQVSDCWHLIEVEKQIEPELDDQQRQKILHRLFEAWIHNSIADTEVTLAI